MKKFLVSLVMLLAITGLTAAPLNAPTAQAATKKVVKKVVKKPVKKAVKAKKIVKKTSKLPTTMKWDAGALKLVSNMASFDYNTAIRNSYIKKVEAYAKRNGYKTVTAAVVNGMHE